MEQRGIKPKLLKSKTLRMNHHKAYAVGSSPARAVHVRKADFLINGPTPKSRNRYCVTANVKYGDLADQFEANYVYTCRSV